MKRTIGIEWIGFESQKAIDALEKLYSFGAKMVGATVCAEHPKSNRPWLAEITGIDPKFKFSRNFLSGKIDFSQSYKRGDRGVMLYFILEDNKIYELKKDSGKRERRYFFKMINGEQQELTEDEVIECLKSRSA